MWLPRGLGSYSTSGKKKNTQPSETTTDERDVWRQGFHVVSTRCPQYATADPDRADKDQHPMHHHTHTQRTPQQGWD